MTMRHELTLYDYGAGVQPNMTMRHELTLYDYGEGVLSPLYDSGVEISPPYDYGAGVSPLYDYRQEYYHSTTMGQKCHLFMTTGEICTSP
jgi:hypothetical protein